MKKFLFSLILCSTLFNLKAQQGFLNLNDFSNLNNPQGWPFSESIYWLRGTTPAGYTRIMVYRGTLQARFLQDTFLMPKLSLRNDPNPYKLLWIGQDSMLRAIVPPYLNIVDTTGKWLGAGTTIPAAQINSDWNSVSGPSQILNKPNLGLYYLASNPDGYITASSTNTLTNKSGDISMWTNDANYITRTGISATAPVAYDNSTGVISMAAANGSTNGYLTSTDWTTFNNKLSSVDTGNISNFYLKVRSLLSAGTGISYNSVTGVITNSAPAQTPSFSTPTRSLSTTGSNNTFTISASRSASVHYTVNFSVALVLTTSNGAVDLDYSLDGGTNWINVSRVSQIFGASVTITAAQDMVLCGDIPANALVRINRVSNTNSTITLTTRQQEKLEQ